MEVRFVEGMRVSDAETVEVAKMVLLGKVNSDIVMRLNRHGQPAVGLSGEDGALFEIAPACRTPSEVGFVGEIERVDVDVLNHIAADYIPVIASAGVDREGHSYNVNADTAAGKVAAALGALQGDLPHRRRGLARRPRRRGLADLAGDASPRSRRRSPASAAACGRSSRACVEAIRGGVGSAHIIDGRRPHSLLLELFTDAGIGTMVTP